MENNKNRFLIEVTKQQIIENLETSKHLAHKELQSEIQFLSQSETQDSSSVQHIEVIRQTTLRNRAAWGLLATFAAELIILSPLLGVNVFWLMGLALATMILCGFQLYKNDKLEKRYGAIIYKNIRTWYFPKIVRSVKFI